MKIWQSINMQNLDYLPQQKVFDRARMLFNARHDSVTERLSSPEKSFVPFIVQELAQTVFYGLGRDEKPVAAPTSEIEPDLDKIMETYHALELGL